MVDILLATYNGERFIKEQIMSILAQSYKDWHLYIQDDCSTDGTYEIVCEFQSKYPERITVKRNEEPSGSAKANFMSMLQLADANYIMFADQDDVWRKNKVEKTLNAMKKLEHTLGTAKPALVHTDLYVVDEELKLLQSSMFKFQGLKGKYKTVNRLLAQNNVTGCTMMINRTLLYLVKNVDPSYIRMHDWWMALTAAAFGGISFINEPTVKYRQHSGNNNGALSLLETKDANVVAANGGSLHDRIQMTYDHAKDFYKAYKNELTFQGDAKPCKLVMSYMNLDEQPKPKRVYMILKNRFLKQKFVSAIGQIFFC